MYFIKSFHAAREGERKRLWFWQTPWVVPYDDKPLYREIGGWVTYSGHATVYADQREAEAVNAIRALGGEVVNAGPYLRMPE